MREIEKCYSCNYFASFNCSCTNKHIIMCTVELAEHDKKIRDEVMIDTLNSVLK